MVGFRILLILLPIAASFSNENCSSENSLALEISRRYNLNEVLFDKCNKHYIEKRRIDPKFHGHPKTRGEIYVSKFQIEPSTAERQADSLVNLINKVAEKYLNKCPPIIYYDKYVEVSESLILQKLFKTFPLTFFQGQIDENHEAINTDFRRLMDNSCRSYILFLSDPLMTRKVIGSQVESRVILASRSSQWKLRDFLSSEKSSNIVNLLVIGESLVSDPEREKPYVLYTHKLYADGLGSNIPVVLTSWVKGVFSRPHINLFPKKFNEGFSGHRFTVSAINQPPFIFRIRQLDKFGQEIIRWEGIEYRLINIIANQLNFSIDIIEPMISTTLGSSDVIVDHVERRKSDFGMAGVYITEDRLDIIDMSKGHSRDCAAFITLASKALPKYRAILGPFQWPVWVALTAIYLGGVVPIVYTDQLSLSHIMGNWGELENMFWYIFGMFTNSFTFNSKYSWSNSKRISTRILIGFYWIFTIIITSCYTGSIIAFVTLPAFPDTLDSVNDLLGLFFRVGTLDRGGWNKWFQNSTHEPTSKLFKKMEFVSSLEEGIGNVTQSFFWNYAFLGSRAQLEYLVQANYTNDALSRRSALHLSEECFAPFDIGFTFPKNSVYAQKISQLILLAQQSGLIEKINNEVAWAMQRSSSGKLLQASSSHALRERIQEERQLTTADTEGMYLLMGIGYILGALALGSEIIGGFTNKCRQLLKQSRDRDKSNISSGRISVDITDKNELAEHFQRKTDRRNLHDLRNSKRNFLKEFNLTKATLKEMYGSYHRSEPNIILQNGELILETSAVSTDSLLRTPSISESGNIPTDTEIGPDCTNACINVHDEHGNIKGIVEIEPYRAIDEGDLFGSLIDDKGLGAKYDNLSLDLVTNDDSMDQKD